jgi:hypothetical protein
VDTPLFEEIPAVIERPTLEIVSDELAVIRKGTHSYELRGGIATHIIANYRHCLTHEDRGEQDAALFLWGLVNGLEHAHVTTLEREVEAIRTRRIIAP